MKITTDGIDLIESWARLKFFESHNLEVMVLQDHWDLSSLAGRNFIENCVDQGIVKLVNPEEIHYSQVFEVRDRFKGLHLSNCALLAYCKSSAIRLVTSDMALIWASRELNHSSIDSDLFKREMLTSSKIKAVESGHRLKSFEMKILKELGPD